MKEDGENEDGDRHGDGKHPSLLQKPEDVKASVGIMNGPPPCFSSCVIDTKSHPKCGAKRQDQGNIFYP